MKKRVWGFTHEENARRCVALIAAGDNAQCTIELHEGDECWEVFYAGQAGDTLTWLRGFACAFARTIPDESDVGPIAGTEPAGVSAEWVLSQLAGMKFPKQGGAYDFMKKCLDDGVERKPGDHVCAECGSDDVQHAFWVNPNTHEVIDVFGTWNEEDAVFCNACESHGGIVDRDDYVAPVAKT